MPHYYPSKVDTWFYLTTGLAAALMIASGIMVWVIEPQEAPMAMPAYALGLVTIIGLPLWLIKTTGYTLERTRLLIKTGPFSWEIPLAEIREISPTRNWLSSPALSLDRLLIKYGKRGRLMISPADKEGFLRELENLRAQLRPYE